MSLDNLNNLLDDVITETIEIDNVDKNDDKYKGPKSLINPYELLGLNIKNKTLTDKDVKKAYYQLALICHPDKGGDGNDMSIIHQAYTFVKEQVIHNQNLTDSKLEEAESKFKQFLSEQEDTKAEFPPFSDIFHDIRDWQRKFNKKFEEIHHKDVEDTNNSDELNDHSFGHMSANYGYGSEMVNTPLTSHIGNNTESTSNFTSNFTSNTILLDYNKIKNRYVDEEADRKVLRSDPPSVDKDFFRRGNQSKFQFSSDSPSPLTSFGREIIAAKKDDDISGRYTDIQEFRPLNQLSLPAEYYKNQRGFGMTDYKTAHQEPCLVDLTQFREKNISPEKLVEFRIKERQEMDKVTKRMLDNGQDIELTFEKEKRKSISNAETLARSYIISNMLPNTNLIVEDKLDHITVEEESDDDFVIIDHQDVIRAKIDH